MRNRDRLCDRGRGVQITRGIETDCVIIDCDPHLQMKSLSTEKHVGQDSVKNKNMWDQEHARQNLKISKSVLDCVEYISIRVRWTVLSDVNIKVCWAVLSYTDLLRILICEKEGHLIRR
jgi:hypothetical protein